MVKKLNRCRMSVVSVVLAASVFLFCVPSLMGDVSPVFFRVEASNASGSGVYEVTSGVSYDPATQTYSWQGSGIIIKDGSTPIATLDSATVIIQGDPKISLTFAATAGTTQTHFILTTALLSFPTLASAEGLASVGMTVTERDGNTAVLTGAGPDGCAYLAQYNGHVPSGTTFAQFIHQIVVSNPYGSNAANENTGGFIPIAGPVQDMSVQLNFNLSAKDSASSTSAYVIIPEPSILALLAVGLAVLRRR